MATYTVTLENNIMRSEADWRSFGRLPVYAAKPAARLLVTEGFIIQEALPLYDRRDTMEDMEVSIEEAFKTREEWCEHGYLVAVESPRSMHPGLYRHDQCRLAELRSYDDWKAMGRRVRRGEKMVGRRNRTPVFELSQTDEIQVKVSYNNCSITF